MSEKKENNIKAESNIIKDNKPNINNNENDIIISQDNNDNIDSYTYKNGNKLVLSGINLQIKENQELLNKLISSHLTAIEVDLSNCNLNKFPEILYKLNHYLI